MGSVKNLAGKFAKASWRYYIFPTSFTRLAGAIAIQQAVHAGVGLTVYPGPEEYLAELGIDKNASHDMLPSMPAFVRPTPQDRTFLDHIYSLTDGPTIGGIAMGLKTTLQYSPGHVAVGLVNAACDISLPRPDEDMDVKNLLSLALIIPEDTITTLPLPDESYIAAIMLHEAGHCSRSGVFPDISSIFNNTMLWVGLQDVKITKTNARDIMGHEEISDMHSMYGSMRTGKPEDKKHSEDFWLYLRSSTAHSLLLKNMDKEHDLVLFHDARLNGTTEPTLAEWEGSRAELSDYIKPRLEEIMGEEIYDGFQLKDLIPSLEKPVIASDWVGLFMLRTVHGFLNDSAITKSPFAVRRAELYIEGMRYFAPKIVEKALGPENPSPLAAPAPAL